MVRCCHSRCIGRHEGHIDPGGRGTGHRSLTSLKSISWQLAGGKPAISNQVPDHFTHIFQNLFSSCSAPLLLGFKQTLPCRAAILPHGATVFGMARKVQPHLSDFRSDLKITKLSTNSLSNSKHATPATLTSVLPCTLLPLWHTKCT